MKNNSIIRDLIYQDVLRSAYHTWEFSTGKRDTMDSVEAITEVVHSLMDALENSKVDPKYMSISHLLKEEAVKKLVVICAQNDIRFTHKEKENEKD